MGSFRTTGLTGDGSVQLDGGAGHEVTEIDVAVTHKGFFVTENSTIPPRRLYQVGWVGLSVSAAFPGTSTPLFQWLTLVLFIDGEYRIWEEPSANPYSPAWFADTLMWGVRDSVFDINVWFV